ncbi:MAG: DUF4091 domain-containing protein [Planctomycetes bacterium]|nr:DUF4091 domain-containing protein [Planctomycetota bacterium]
MRWVVPLIVSLLVPLAVDRARGAEEKGIRLSVLGSMERIAQDQKPLGSPEATIRAARNEVESFQVVVAALGGNLEVVRAEISDLVGDNGARIGSENIRLYREEYVRVRRSTSRAELPPGLYPDPLVPFLNPLTAEPIQPRKRTQARWGEPATTSGHDMFALPLEIFAGQNQPIWVDVHVPLDAAPGTYRGTFTVASRNRLTAEVPVTLVVWDFTLPPGPTHSNHFGHFSGVAPLFDVKRDSPRFHEIELAYCRAMAEHRINPPLPRHLLPEVKADGSLNVVPERHAALVQFMNELNVTDFEIPRAPFARLPSSTLRPDYNQIKPDQREKAQRYYRQYYDYVKANGWHERAYVYLLDEPNRSEIYEQVLVLGAMVHEAVPELRCLVVEQTYPQDTAWPDIDPAIDIWCPLWSFIDEKTIRAKIAGGDEVWSYTALVQPAPRYHPQYESVKNHNPPYWHIDRSPVVYRMPTWINYRYGITGLLYWSTVTRVIEPWSNPAFAHPRHYNGGGYLFYPGVPCGIDGPVTCIRLKNLRDGMEDYEYFALLEKLAGREAVDEIVRQAAPNWWDYCREPGSILAVRRELAERIVREQGESK